MQQRRHHQHYVPQFYLNGFTESPTSDLIWVYEKGSQQPPFSTGARVIAVEKHFYSFDDDTGMRDSNTLEVHLEEKIERPTNPIINKVRTRQAITAKDKHILSTYLCVMMKRVPKHRERQQNLAPQVIASVGDQLERELADEKSRREAQKILNEYEGELPKKFLLERMTDVTRLVQYLEAMTWQFLISNSGSVFLTSDNPVFFDESIGIANKYSEITVPISKNVALWATWREDLEEGFIPVRETIVREINRRTVYSATRYIYHSAQEQWVINLANKKNIRLHKIVGSHRLA